MMLRVVFLAIALGLLLNGCKRTQGQPLYTNSGGLALSLTDTNRLVSGLNQLKAGDSEPGVLAKVGTPNDRFVAGPNKSADPGKNFTFLRYVVRQKNSWAVYDSDQYVEIQLDHEGHLLKVTPHNVEGVKQIP